MNEFEYQPEDNGKRKILIGFIAAAVLLAVIVGTMVVVMRKRASDSGQDVSSQQGTSAVNTNVSGPPIETQPAVATNAPFVPLEPIKPDPPPYPLGEEHVMTEAEKQEYGYGGVTGEVRYKYVADHPNDPNSSYTRVVTKSPEPVPAVPIDPTNITPKAPPKETP